MIEPEEAPINELVTALVAAKTKFKTPKKSKQAYNYKYADLQECIDCTQDALNKNGLVVAQFPINEGENVGVETTVAHTSGQRITSTFTAKLPKTDPQSIGSALTYFRRYGYMAALGLAPEDDDAQTAMPADKVVDSFDAIVSLAETDPGDYVFTFGKFKGQPIRSVPDSELQNYGQYLVRSAEQQGKKLSGPAKEAHAAIDLYFSDK